jgi:recombination protein RecR
VVEESRDIVAIEKTGEFRGRYHVLLGAMNPLEGIGPEQLKMKELFARIEPEDVRRSSCAPTPTPRAR